MKHLSRLAAAICLFTSSARSQQCSNTHDGAMLLSVSINGYSVDQIGRSEYLDIIEDAAAAIIQTSGQDVGLQTFAGDGDAFDETTYVTDILDGFQSDTSLMSGGIQDIINSDFDINYGNSVSKALENAIDLFSNIASSNQKYHVLFAAGNPLQGQIGDTTNAGNYDDPCADARDAKNAHIQTYVALIGEQGRNFVKEYYSCLVEDPSTDIIIIDPTDTTAGIDALTDRVCKENGYDVRITEVNPTFTTGSYEPFIEIHNRGAPLSLKACWDSATGDCSGSSTASTGQFFVAACSSCQGTNPGRDNGALSAAGSSTSWTAVAATGNTELDRVTHGSGDYWQTSQTGRSFELRGIGYNNDYGGNWRVSCYDGTDDAPAGSPRSEPAECVATENSCSDNAWGGCTANGGSGQCLAGNLYQWCGCSSAAGFLGDVDTCIVMPEFSTSCTAYVINDRLGAVYTHFAVEKPDWDGDITYRLTYTSDSGLTTNLATGGVNMGAVADADTEDTTITMRATYTAPLSGTTSTVDTTMTCGVITQEPTTNPTPMPTPMPTGSPSPMPTQSPTFGQIGVFLKGSNVCAGGITRCECFDEDITCCLSSSDDCADNMYSLEISPEQDSTFEETVTIEAYSGGAQFTQGVNITYTVTAFGTFNISDFESLSWADTNGSVAGPKPDTLAIDVSPPGGLNLSVGQSIEIASGDATGQIPLTITTSTLKCEADEECLQYDECLEQAVGYVIEVTGCEDTANVSQGGCIAMYPNTLYVAVSRSNELCAINFSIGDDEEELPDWFWWVLIALLVFLIILCWLVYRFWWSQKKTAAELGDAEDELDQQHADNEAGFGKDLDVGDVAFNPMATGVPGMDRPADAFGNEIQQRQMHAQNDMVDVQAEVFQVRQDYGQVQTGMPRGGM